MTVVKQLVKSGITVCATIHSPTPYGRLPRPLKYVQFLFRILLAPRFLAPCTKADDLLISHWQLSHRLNEAISFLVPFLRHPDLVT